MLPRRSIQMRFISKEQVRDLITLSYATIDREEAAGTFQKEYVGASE
jgi:hypothetical protein